MATHKELLFQGYQYMRSGYACALGELSKELHELVHGYTLGMCAEATPVPCRKCFAEFSKMHDALGACTQATPVPFGQLLEEVCEFMHGYLGT